jgi:hypothetical protein
MSKAMADDIRAFSYQKHVNRPADLENHLGGVGSRKRNPRNLAWLEDTIQKS